MLQDERKKRVGGYILGRTLGEGSFAKVRQGVHVATNEKVTALRFVKKKFAVIDCASIHLSRTVLTMFVFESCTKAILA